MRRKNKVSFDFMSKRYRQTQDSYNLMNTLCSIELLLGAFQYEKKKSMKKHEPSNSNYVLYVDSHLKALLKCKHKFKYNAKRNNKEKRQKMNEPRTSHET